MLTRPLAIIMSADLSLAVQYGVACTDLPRWRLRRWAQRAVNGALTDGCEAAARVGYNIRLVGQAEGRQLNLAFRQRDYATNVFTFEYGSDPEGRTCSDIVICLPVLKREAREQGKTLRDHAAHLTMHGCLHALGYDHIRARDAKRMEALETALLATLGIADPYRPR